ncbi:hypothetical protein FB451DRAFT_772831 [Mycena latifolia]|nr:hypothetical protein FB451DRAFT_772831 [Mycena latifolia]
MSPPQLAQELLEAIVGTVQGKDNLKACALVSRSFVNCSQRELFRSLCLFTNPLGFRPTHPTEIPTFGFSSAHDLLAMSPHLARYVRDLTLFLEPTSTEDYGFLESILRQVSERLSRLSMCALRLFFPWHDMPSDLTSLLRDIYVRPDFRSLSLTGILGVPSSLIFYAASSLQSISISKITIREDSGSDIPTFIAKPREISHATLEDVAISARVDFGYDQDRYRSILDVELHTRLRGIQKLALRFSAAQSDQWEPFLLESDIHGTLEHLALSFAHELPALQLPLFPLLRVLKVRFGIGVQTLLEPLWSVLSTLPTCTPLLEALFLTVQCPRNILVGWTLIDVDAHPVFHSAGELQKNLPRLTECHCFHIARQDDVARVSDAGFAQYMKQKLRGAAEAGILAVSSQR